MEQEFYFKSNFKYLLVKRITNSEWFTLILHVFSLLLIRVVDWFYLAFRPKPLLSLLERYKRDNVRGCCGIKYKNIKYKIRQEARFMLAGLIIIFHIDKFDDDDDYYWPSPATAGRSYKQLRCSVCTAWHRHWFINQELGGRVRRVKSRINISTYQPPDTWQRQLIEYLNWTE